MREIQTRGVFKRDWGRFAQARREYRQRWARWDRRVVVLGALYMVALIVLSAVH